MIRVLLSAVAVVGLAGAGFYLYSSYFAPEKRAAAGPNITSGATPPSLPAPTPQPPPTPIVQPPAPKVETPPAPPVLPAPPAPPAPKLKHTHVVQAGESLSSISRKYYGTPDRYAKIAAANNLRGRDLIRTGQVLVIPDVSGPLANENTGDEKDEPLAKSVDTQDFEPQPPTLNTTQKRDENAPKK